MVVATGFRLSVEAIAAYLEVVDPIDLAVVVHALIRKGCRPSIIWRAAHRAVAPTRAWADVLEEVLLWLPR